MKIIRTFAYIFGAVALIFGASSCNKEEDSVKCCTYTYDGQSEKICEDDEEFKTYAEEYGLTWSQYAATLETLSAFDEDMDVKCD